MNRLHKINRLIFILTLAAYLTIFGGMLAQMLLGVIQIVIAGIMSKKYPLSISKNKRLIINYWKLTCTSLLLSVAAILFSKFSDISTALFIIALFVLPMFIASYFMYVTFTINKNLTKP